MHRDKTHEEILGVDTNLFNNKYFFIFVLKGEGTLYFSFEKQERSAFDKYATDGMRSFGYHVKELEEHLYGKFNTSEYLSPNFGYGRCI